MGTPLKQSTAVTVKLGPFVDEDDGKTLEPSLTISQADIRLSKNGGNYAQTNNATGATYDESGDYDIPLDTTDTNTLGTLRVMVVESGALPVWRDFDVYPANVYDSQFSTDKLEVDVTQFGGTNLTASAGIPAVNATQFSGSATAADNAEVVLANDFATNYDTTNDMWNVDVTRWGGVAVQLGDNDLPAVDVSEIEGNPPLTKIQTAAETALQTYHLDHLIASADPGSIVANSSLLAKLVSKSGTPAFSSFNNTTDSLEALRDNVGTAGAGLTAVAWNAAWGAEIESKVNDALVAIHLDHLLAADYDPASKPGVSTALLNELVESDAGVSRYTANALELAPTGGSAPTAADIRAEIDANSTQLAAIVEDTGTTLPAQIAAKNVMLTGTATAGASTTITFDGSAVASTDYYKNALVRIVSGTGIGQTREISAYSSGRVATVTRNWTVNPASDSDYEVLATDQNTQGTYALASGASGFVVLAGAISTALTNLATVDGVVDAILLDTGTDGVVVASGSKTGYTLASSHDIYHADISLCIDEANTQDEYAVTWFKNGVRQTSGITSPTIQVVKRADGTDLIASTAMTQIGSTGSYKYDATTTARTTAGEAVIVVVGATIDASGRTFSKVLTRDSTA